MPKVIVLASGGLDSSLVMAKLLREGHEVVPMFTNYGQYSYEGEAKAVRSVQAWLSRAIHKWDLPLGTGIRPVVEVKVDIGQRTAACPGRILAFCGAAAIWAFTNDWDEGLIAIGIHKGDKDQDSCRVGYEGALNGTLWCLTQGKLQIMTPLMGMTREAMAKEIQEIGIPWEIMYNCYWGPTPCGFQSPSMTYRCPGCRRKAEAMQIAGVPDSELQVVNKASGWDRDIARRDWKYG
jgi:7-cyano-7-deazaguanine synthase